MRKHCIYILEFPNGKAYIGQTVNFKRRMADHRRSVRKPKFLINYAIRKYGWNNVKKRILLYCDKNMVDYYEKECIKAYNTLTPNGYNLEGGGKSKHSVAKSTIEKHRKNNTGKNNPRYGKTYTKAERLNLSIKCGSKPFKVYKDDKFIGEFINQSELQEKLGIAKGTITKLLKGKGKSCKGYRFYYSDGSTNYVDKTYICKTTCLGRVGALHPMFGKTQSEAAKDQIAKSLGSKEFKVYKENVLVGSWVNKARCARDLGINPTGIGKCLNNRQKQTWGYTFEYI